MEFSDDRELINTHLFFVWLGKPHFQNIWSIDWKGFYHVNKMWMLWETEHQKKNSTWYCYLGIPIIDTTSISIQIVAVKITLAQFI